MLNEERKSRRSTNGKKNDVGMKKGDRIDDSVMRSQCTLNTDGDATTNANGHIDIGLAK